MKVDQRLSDWKRSLPIAMMLFEQQEFVGVQPQDWPYTRSQTVLNLRYLSIRLLVYRPVLVKCLDDIQDLANKSKDSDFSSAFLNRALNICSKTAMDIINLAHAVSSRSDLLPAWWFTAYFGQSSCLLAYQAPFN